MRKKIAILIVCTFLIGLVLIPLSVSLIPGKGGLLLYRDTDYQYNLPDSNDFGVQMVIQPDYYSDKAAIPSEPTELVEPEKRVNINTASAQELDEKLPGIGEKKAAAIVEYRRYTGGFRSVEELIEVDGIGEKLMNSLRPYCVISDDELSD